MAQNAPSRIGQDAPGDAGTGELTFDYFDGGPRKTVDKLNLFGDDLIMLDGKVAALEKKKKKDSPTEFWVSRNGVIRRFIISAEAVETIV